MGPRSWHCPDRKGTQQLYHGRLCRRVELLGKISSHGALVADIRTPNGQCRVKGQSHCFRESQGGGAGQGNSRQLQSRIGPCYPGLFSCSLVASDAHVDARGRVLVSFSERGGCFLQGGQEGQGGHGNCLGSKQYRTPKRTNVEEKQPPQISLQDFFFEEKPHPKVGFKCCSLWQFQATQEDSRASSCLELPTTEALGEEGLFLLLVEREMISIFMLIFDTPISKNKLDLGFTN
mmetsp:Transcript_17939/g.41498  ORF Transcript_17939/g.41498 Transcript_17939/m.41498 type:complete len:234 (+) Transcript_17939:350-1051(+)